MSRNCIGQIPGQCKPLLHDHLEFFEDISSALRQLEARKVLLPMISAGPRAMLAAKQIGDGKGKCSCTSELLAIPPACPGPFTDTLLEGENLQTVAPKAQEREEAKLSLPSSKLPRPGLVPFPAPRSFPPQSIGIESCSGAALPSRMTEHTQSLCSPNSS